jgi:arabinofuranosyltransferase
MNSLQSKSDENTLSRALSRWSRSSFIIISLSFCLYSALFVWRTSYVIDGVRYFCLFDDEMVSMRYARNLARGYGLVWNPGGERVEGFSNPLWVVSMAGLHLLPVSPSKICLLVQISGAIFLLLNLFVVKKIAEIISEGSLPVTLGAVLLTAFYLPLNNWGLQGTEVSLLTLLISFSVWRALKAIREDRFSLGPYLAVGLGILVRLDMVIPYLVLLVFLILNATRTRKRNGIAGLIVLLVVLVPQTLFRMWYYGDVLPNTYYLKMTGYPLIFRITRGITAAYQFGHFFNMILFLLPFSVFLFRRDTPIRLLFLVFWAQVGYSIFVGGDAWEWWGGSNRYIALAIPLFFILLAYSITALVTWVEGKVDTSPSVVRKALKYAPGFLLLLAMINVNSIYGPTALSEWLLFKRTLHVEDNEQRVGLALFLKEITRPEARIAVTWAGTVPYFSDRYGIDLLGKTDRFIARLPMRTSSGLSRWSYFHPGHLKWDYGYSIGQLKPDIVLQVWKGTDEAVINLYDDYLMAKPNGFPMFLRKGSENIYWDRLGNIVQ